MSPNPFETFDPTPYQRAPLLDILNTLSLGRALLEVVPTEPPEVVEREAGKLEAVLDEGDEAVDARRRESIPVDMSGEVELDALVDGLWATFRSALEAKATLPAEGLAVLLEDHKPQSTVGKAVAAAREQAERAQALSNHVFGADGLAFTKKQFSQQSQAMASMLRVIEGDGLAPEIEALCGPEILVLLRACQPLYASMVDARLARDNRKSIDLGWMRNKIMRAITRYSTAVLTMIDEDDPESLPRVIAALRPFDQSRALSAASGRPSASTATAPEAAPEAAPEPELEPA